MTGHNVFCIRLKATDTADLSNRVIVSWRKAVCQRALLSLLWDNIASLWLLEGSRMSQLQHKKAISFQKDSNFKNINHIVFVCNDYACWWWEPPTAEDLVRCLSFIQTIATRFHSIESKFMWIPMFLLWFDLWRGSYCQFGPDNSNFEWKWKDQGKLVHAQEWSQVARLDDINFMHALSLLDCG